MVKRKAADTTELWGRLESGTPPRPYLPFSSIAPETIPAGQRTVGALSPEAAANPPQDVQRVFQALHPDWSGASWALRWVVSLENVAVILSGMSTLQQVEDNLNTFACAEPLTEEEKRAVEQAAAIYRSRVRVPCTGCAYCMPCPAGVNIPEIFKIYNHASVYDMQQQGKGNYRQLDDKQKAAHCVKCGKCVKACPQKIAIPEMMTEINQWANG